MARVWFLARRRLSRRRVVVGSWAWWRSQRDLLEERRQVRD
jgi:hypothetical protein